MANLENQLLSFSKNGGSTDDTSLNARLNSSAVSSGLSQQNAKARRKSEEEQKRLEEERQQQQKQQQEQKTAAQNNPFKGVGEFAAAFNEKVLGGGSRLLTKGYNALTSGFNNDEANKKTEDFLRTTKQINDKGQSTLAAGVDRGSAAFKAGETTGNIAQIVNPLEVAKGTYNAAKNITEQTRISGIAKDQNAIIGQSAADKLKKFVDEDEKAGLITKQQADTKRAKLQAEADKSKAAIKKAETEVGAKYNPESAVSDILINVAGLEGLGPIAKSVFNSVAKQASKRLGRELTEEEAKNLATQTKNTVPEERAQALPVSRASETGAISAAPLEAKVAPNAVESSLEPTVKAPALPESTSISIKPTVELPKPVAIKQINGEADINDLASKAGNSFRNQMTGVKEGAIDRAKQEIENGTAKPIRIRTTDEGKVVIEDGRHRLQAAQELGMKSFPVEDVSSSYGSAAKSLQPVGDTVSGNAARIEARGLEKKLTERMGDLPEYKSINMKEQAQEAADLITNNRKLAIDVIEGKANAPGSLKAQSVHQALEELAIKEGDGELLTKLAKSHVNTELSGSAQNLRIAAERDPNSAVEQIRQIRDARVKAAERRSKTTVTKEAKDITKKVDAATPKATKQDWASFVKELTC